MFISPCILPKASPRTLLIRFRGARESEARKPPCCISRSVRHLACCSLSAVGIPTSFREMMRSLLHFNLSALIITLKCPPHQIHPVSPYFCQLIEAISNVFPTVLSIFYFVLTSLNVVPMALVLMPLNLKCANMDYIAIRSSAGSRFRSYICSSW